MRTLFTGKYTCIQQHKTRALHAVGVDCPHRQCACYSSGDSGESASTKILMDLALTPTAVDRCMLSACAFCHFVTVTFSASLIWDTRRRLERCAVPLGHTTGVLRRETVVRLLGGIVTGVRRGCRAQSVMEKSQFETALQRLPILWGGLPSVRVGPPSSSVCNEWFPFKPRLKM